MVESLQKSTLTLKQMIVWLMAALLVALLVMIACSFIGHYHIAIEPTPRFWTWSIWRTQLWQGRVFRLAAAGLVGLGLSNAGLALQALLRNPLAEPYVLGISSGAGIGVLLGPAMAQWISMPEWISNPTLAMIGALTTAAIVYAVAQRAGRLDPYVLLLSGVIVNIFNGALILGILQFVKQTDMIHFIGWGMGQIPEWLWFRPSLLIVSAVLIAAGWVVLLLRAHAFNTLGLGDEVAVSVGVSVKRLRIEAFIFISLMTAAAVTLAGPVGFVGLIVPHTCRLILGPDHRRLTVVAGLSGAVFMMAADTLSRLVGQWLNRGELPVGVITAIVGAPLFVAMLWRRSRRSS